MSWNEKLKDKFPKESPKKEEPLILLDGNQFKEFVRLVEEDLKSMRTRILEKLLK